MSSRKRPAVSAEPGSEQSNQPQSSDNVTPSSPVLSSSSSSFVAKRARRASASTTTSSSATRSRIRNNTDAESSVANSAIDTDSIADSQLSRGDVADKETHDESAAEAGVGKLFEDADDPELEEALLADEADGEDLFGSDMEKDYDEIPELDRYDLENLDERDYEDMDIAERRAVDRELARRERLAQAGTEARGLGRLPRALALAEDDFEDEEFLNTAPTRKRHRTDARAAGAASGEAGASMEEDTGELEVLEDTKGNSIRDWLLMDRPRYTTEVRFRKFLHEFWDAKGNPVYEARIRNVCEANGESVEVSYAHLEQHDPVLALFLANAPAEMLSICDKVLRDVVYNAFPEYGRIREEMHVRIVDLPSLENLRDLRHIHLNMLVRVSGVVTRRTGVFPQLKYVRYDCVKCGYIIGPIYQGGNSTEAVVSNCPSCQSKGPFAVNSEQTTYDNYQKITLQESPGSVPPGRLPRHKEVILLADLIDSARPGEEIEVTGIYRNNFDIALNTKNGFPVFATVIEANHVSKKEDLFASFRLTDDDVQKILALAKDERIGQRIIKSIAPSIYGHEHIKTAIALSMFGGSRKEIRNKHSIRGDINVLLLGDPGTAKSQFLKYVEKTAHRCVFTTGQGASAVGLTASVRRDPVTREWTLEGGALVLADKGVCLIDEFDKMNDKDRTSIHEAMEQQSISISKAGIVTSLQARCAIIAAANPVRGRYDPSVTFSENVDLTEPILSRFDALCVVKDVVDPISDEKLAKFVVGSHIRSHPQFTVANAEADASGNGDTDLAKEMSDLVQLDKDIIPQDLLKKYIMYAKEKIKPKLQSGIDDDKISKLYSELRRESLASGSIPITVRHIESMIRMAEAHARMHLRDYVRADDVDMAIRVMLESFIGAQKYSIMKTMQKTFSKYLAHKRDNDELLLFLLQGLVRETIRYYQYRYDAAMPKEVDIEMEDFEMRAREFGVHDVKSFYKSKQFVSNNFRVDWSRKLILRDFDELAEE